MLVALQSNCAPQFGVQVGVHFFMKLSDTKIRRLRTTERGELYDGAGLVLRVGPQIGKRWQLRYRLKGSSKYERLDLGPYPHVGLAEARTKACAIRELLAAGANPKEAMKQRGALTVRELYELFLEEHNNKRSVGTIAKYRRTFEHHVLPYWGDKEPNSLREPDLAWLIKNAEGIRKVDNLTLGGVGASENVRLTVKKLWKWAKPKGFIAANDFTEATSAYEYVKRDRVLSMSEARKVWQSLDVWGSRWGTYPFAYYLRLMMLSPARRGEWAEAEWAWIDDLRTLTIPKDETKQRRPHVIPLTPRMMEIIHSLPRNGCYLFTTTGSTPISGFSNMNRRLSTLTGLQFTLHDLRRTIGTHLQRLGVEKEVLRALLGHRQRGSVDDVYFHYEFFDEKRAALELWDNELTG